MWQKIGKWFGDNWLRLFIVLAVSFSLGIWAYIQLETLKLERWKAEQAAVQWVLSLELKDALRSNLMFELDPRDMVRMGQREAQKFREHLWSLFDY